MTYIIQLLKTTLDKVMLAFAHNWIYLLASVLVGSLIKLFIDKDRVAGYLQKHQKGGVALATAVAVGTPLCSCGTTAIVIGMMASMMPWAPIVAFMVASPLTSPEELVYSAGLFGWTFAWSFFISSILLGLAGGVLATILDHQGWLAGQARFADEEPKKSSPEAALQARLQVAQSTSVPASPRISLPLFAAEACCDSESPVSVQPLPASAVTSACGCNAAAQTAVPHKAAGSCVSDACSGTARPRPEWMVFLSEIWGTGVRLLVLFTGFAFIGYFINGLVPASWISRLFGSGNLYSVPLAATLGLPFYLNTEATLPLIRALLDDGMSSGSALAFMISGAGTSIGAIVGALTIARWRVVALVVAILWIGAMLCGFAYDFLAAGLRF
jgi:uncharacterized membrane protein YraQ (UPF0718 family)